MTAAASFIHRGLPTARPRTLGGWPGRWVAVVGLLLCCAGPASAELSHRVALLGAAGLWVTPESGGHGVGLVGYDLGGLPRGSSFSAELNTDTLRLRYGGLRFWDGLLELSFGAAGEVFLAGLLSDYYRGGVRDTTRGFNASYASLFAAAKLNLPGRHHLALVTGVRKWWFSAAGDTADGLVLPDGAWAFEPTLRYTHWNLRHDPGWSERHRLFPRLRGLAFGVEVKLDIRSSVKPWGARASSFDPVDRRNDPNTVGLTVTQWALAGWQITDRVRTQLRQSTGWGYGLDDVNRVRVGGMNPYVVPVAGAPWAAWLSDGYLAVRWSWHVKVAGDVEVGALGDLAYLTDPGRTGQSNAGVEAGVGLFGDLRWGAFQLDLQLGWCPTLDDQSGAGQLAAFVALGWQWS